MQAMINIILSYLIGSISGSMVLGYIKGIDIKVIFYQSQKFWKQQIFSVYLDW